MITKQKLEDYSEPEFFEFLKNFFSNEESSSNDELDENIEEELKAMEAYEAHQDSLVDHFRKITQHPAGSDLIFYPKQGAEGPQGIINEIKKWRAANGKSGFKPA
ncbi:bacteriocin immunity protein [Pseudomonas sp.]|uniref:bacteriocin immunity protein n=1 Tax=Pseudomonas sp. TaxID=306 RepID=UPI0028AC1D26|nr:bacteriocin immunity protein [Pseudomonas sp.]